MRRTLCVAAAMLAVAAATGACGSTEIKTDKTGPAAAANKPGPAPELESEQLKRALLAATDLPDSAPAGLRDQTIDIRKGLSYGSAEQPLEDVTFRPPECGAVGPAALGDLAAARGWVRVWYPPERGKPSGPPTDKFIQGVITQAIVVVPGGPDFARVKRLANACRNGTVELAKHGLTGKISHKVDDTAAVTSAEAQAYDEVAVDKEAQFASTSAVAQGFEQAFNANLVLLNKGDFVIMISTTSNAGVTARELAPRAFERAMREIER
jgi:hypothetical protein